MTEYTIAVLIFVVGAVTSLLLVGYIMVNSRRCQRGDNERATQ